MGATGLLQLSRIPALVGLLLATGPVLQDGIRGMTRLQPDAVWGPWAGSVLLATVFVAVALLARRHEHPPAILVVEGIVAAILGFVPPVLWLVWFGMNTSSAALGASSGLVGFVQPLSIAWLGIVVATGLGQRRPDRAADTATTPAPVR